MMLIDELFLRQVKRYGFEIFTTKQKANITFEVVVSNFEQDIWNGFENLAFLEKTEFCQTITQSHVSLESNLKSLKPC